MSYEVKNRDLVEQLNEVPSVRGYFVTAVEIVEASVDELLQRIFRKDDFAVKSVVGPLLSHEGPLGELSVRLKLLFGLGVVSEPMYHDIMKVIEIRDFLSGEIQEYHFTDPQIISRIKRLSVIESMHMLQLDLGLHIGEIDVEFYQMQKARQEKVVRSAMSLGLSTMCEELAQESPF